MLLPASGILFYLGAIDNRILASETHIDVAPAECFCIVLKLRKSKGIFDFKDRSLLGGRCRGGHLAKDERGTECKQGRETQKYIGLMFKHRHVEWSSSGQLPDFSGFTS
jgi:hypothetical protein